MHQGLEEGWSENGVGSRVSPLIIYNRRVMRKYILGLILISVFGIMTMVVWQLWSKNKSDESARGELNTRKISVVTSFYPLYFLLQEIGGEKLDIKNLTPTGVEPHDYEPTAKDILSVQKANLLVLNGGAFETWGNKVKEDLQTSGVTVIEVGVELFERNDPHVWLSPPKIKVMAKKVADALIELDAKNSDFYRGNLVILLERLTTLDGLYVRSLANCEGRDFVTSHDAFWYLAKTYDLNQVSIAGISPDEEPSTRQMTEITKFAKDKEVKYIFFESLVSPKLSETIAEEIGAETLVLDPIEGIGDNDQSLGKNYLTIMEQNLVNLKIALQCQ